MDDDSRGGGDHQQAHGHQGGSGVLRGLLGVPHLGRLGLADPEAWDAKPGNDVPHRRQGAPASRDAGALVAWRRQPDHVDLIATGGQRGNRAEWGEDGPAEAERAGSLELDDAGDQDFG